MENNNFGNLLKQNNVSSNKNNGIYSAKVVSDVCHVHNGKSYILVEIVGMKKQHMIYVDEFADSSVPNKNDNINVIIINHDSQPYGIASYLKAIDKSLAASYYDHIANKTHFTGKVISINQDKYELEIPDFIFKSILITKKKLEIGAMVKVYIKNISNKVAYMLLAINNTLISYTNKLSLLQMVKCRIVGVGSLTFAVDILDNDLNVILANNTGNVVNCVLPFSDLGDSKMSPFQLKDEYKIGDIIEGRIISMSNVKVVVSKSFTDHQTLYNIIYNIKTGQIINATITNINDNLITLESSTDKGTIVYDMLVNELAWSVSQRQQVKQDVIKLGNVIKVQVISIDMRTCKVHVSYKSVNLINPILEFKKEINPATGLNWKKDDLIQVTPIFDMANNYTQKKFFCPVKYKHVDMTLYNWQEDQKIAQSIMNNQPIEVAIVSIVDDISGSVKITVCCPNSQRTIFNDVVNQFVYKGIYKCSLVKSGKYENIIMPICQIDENKELPITLSMSQIEQNNISFVLKTIDTPANIKMIEGNVYICKLVFIDQNKKQFIFSINAYNNDRNNQIALDNSVSHRYNIKFNI